MSIWFWVSLWLGANLVLAVWLVRTTSRAYWEAHAGWGRALDSWHDTIERLRVAEERIGYLETRGDEWKN